MNDLVSHEKLELRGKIHAFEDFLKTMPQIQIPVEHFFTPGIYVREVYIPKDTYMTGSIYKGEHVHIISKGRVIIATEDGQREIVAPCTFIAKAGMKRAGYALEDTVWAAVFHTDKTDPDEIMRDMTTENYGGV
jgi:hypothetical protein